MCVAEPPDCGYTPVVVCSYMTVRGVWHIFKERNWLSILTPLIEKL